MPGKIQILFFQSFGDHAVVNVKVLEKPDPDLNQVYRDPVSGHEWKIINFGFQPAASMLKGIYALSISPVNHHSTLAEGNVLLKVD